MEGVLKKIKFCCQTGLRNSLYMDSCLKANMSVSVLESQAKAFKLKTFKSTIEYSVLQLKKDNK